MAGDERAEVLRLLLLAPVMVECTHLLDGCHVILKFGSFEAAFLRLDWQRTAFLAIVG